MTPHRKFVCRSVRDRSLVLLSASLLLIQPFAQATGFGDPARWIDQESTTVLEPPFFFFEFELKRLASEIKASWKAVPAPAGKGDEESRDFDQQTEDADIADFAAALADGSIKPPNAEDAKEKHSNGRILLQIVHARPDSDGAPSLPKNDLAKIESEFPSEFADYHLGAFYFRLKSYNEAKTAWTKLLARPAAERRYRGAWAAYMLGRMAIYEQDWEEALKRFEDVRALVKNGAIDNIGLAAASYGWQGEAALQLEKFPDAARLFLNQLACGDVSAVYSMRDVMGTMFMNDDYPLAKAVADPVLQRVMTACCVSSIGPFAESGAYERGDNKKETAAERWVHALEAANAKNVRDADRVAWIAYLQGDYSKATRWLGRADANSTYALWLKAKLLMRNGQLEPAAKLVAQVVRAIPKNKLEARSYVEDEISPQSSATGDYAALQFSRGDYLAALKLFVEGRHCSDAVYMAEGILTIEELTAFVDKNTRPPKAPQDPPQDGDDEKESEDTNPDYRTECDFALRSTLVSRLVRAKKFDAARKYLKEDSRLETLNKYEELLKATAVPGLSRPERIKALQEAARYVEDSCSSLLEISDVVIQKARLTGRSAEKLSYPDQRVQLGETLKSTLPVSVTERKRLKQNSSKPLENDLSSYVAADLAWEAAKLMPDNDEETAEWLNEVGVWLMYRHEDAADRFYQAIERRCAKTELGKKAIARHWFIREAEPDSAPQQ